MKKSERADRFRSLERDRFDVVVVGAGIGGLTAAALLARRGYSVLVLDQHYVAGGNATVFRRPGYEFDVGVHYIGDCAPGGSIPGILRAAGVDDVEFRPLDADGFDTLVFPDFTFQVPRGIHRYRERLLEQFPRERRGIDRYIRVLEQFDALQGLAVKPRKAWKVLPRSLTALRYATATLGSFLDTCTRDPKLRAALAAENGDYGQPPSRASLMLHAGLMLHYLKSGGYYPVGGGQVMSDRLADSIERNGGKILLRARVERIVVEDGRATGVVLFNKHVGRREVRAGTVIANSDLKRTLLELVGPEVLSPRTAKRVGDYEMSPALGVVYLGIRGDLAAEGLPNTNYWVSRSYDFERIYENTRAGRFDPDPLVYISIASLKDPENRRIAPPGMTNLQLMSLAPSQPESWGVTPAQVESGAYSKVADYQEHKARYAARLIEGAERVLPGLRDRIVMQEVSTPLTHSRYTLSSGGTSYGLSLIPSQFFLRRPGARTEIENLYLCGASTRMGHGIMGAMMGGLEAASQLVGRQIYGEALRRRPADAAPATPPRRTARSTRGGRPAPGPDSSVVSDDSRSTAGEPGPAVRPPGSAPANP
jgi:phytoene dehydrogenase-like protein